MPTSRGKFTSQRVRMGHPILDLGAIQGDVLDGLPKNVENLIFFKIVNPTFFREFVKQHVIARIISAQKTREWKLAIAQRNARGHGRAQSFQGLNLGFTKDGLTLLIGEGRPKLDGAFEKGPDHPDTDGGIA